MGSNEVDVNYIKKTAKWAEQQKGDGNGKIETNEAKDVIEIFKTQVEKDNADGKIDKLTYDEAIKIDEKAIMGLELSDDKIQTTAAETKFLQRRNELDKVTDKELGKAKVRAVGNGGNYLLNGFTLLDALKFDYLNEDLATDKDGKLTARIKAANPGKSDEEIAKLVDLEKIERQKRFTKKADGTFGEPYNLQELADYIPTDVGADYTWNQSKNKQVAEGTPTVGDFVSQLFPNGIGEFYSERKITKKGMMDKAANNMAKELVKFLGGNIEKNQHKIAEAFKRGTKNGIPPAVGTGLVPFFISENNVVVHVNNQQLQHLGTETSEGALTAILNRVRGMTEEEASAYLKENLGGILQYQANGGTIPIDSRLFNCLANIAVSLGVSIATAVLSDLIFGKAREFEKAVIGLHPLDAINNKQEMTNVDAFKTYVDKHDEQFPKGVKNLVKELAEKFTYTDECGNKKFSYLHLYGFLGQIAGKDSNLNATELLDAMQTQYVRKCLQTWIDKMNKEKACCPDAVKQKPEKPTEESVTQSKTEGTGAAETTEVVISNQEKVAHRVATKTIDARTSSWTKLVQTYECYDTWPTGSKKDARTGKWFSVRERILKLAQGIEDGDYSKERMDKLLEILTTAKTKKEFTDACEKEKIAFNFDEYSKSLGADALKNVRMPENLYGCQRDETKSIKAQKAAKGKGNAYNSTSLKDQYKNEQGAITKDQYDAAIKAGAKQVKWDDIPDVE